MTYTDMITLIASILIPMFAGFGWIIHRISSVDQRLSRMEGYNEGRDAAFKLRVKGE